MSDLVVYLLGAGIVGLVTLALIVWEVRSRVGSVEGEIKRLRDWRHDVENERLGERLRHRTLESD